MVDKNRIIGSAKEAKGTVKQVVGKMTGDAKLEAEGSADKAEGTVQNAIGGLKGRAQGQVGATMSKNTLYLVIGLLAVAIVGFGIYYFYQESQRPSLEIKVD